MRGGGIGRCFVCGLGTDLSMAVFFTLGLGVGWPTPCKGIPLGLGVGLESLWKPQRPFTLALNVHGNPFRFVAAHFITKIIENCFCLIGELVKIGLL